MDPALNDAQFGAFLKEKGGLQGYNRIGKLITDGFIIDFGGIAGIQRITGGMVRSGKLFVAIGATETSGGAVCGHSGKNQQFKFRIAFNESKVQFFKSS